MEQGLKDLREKAKSIAAGGEWQQFPTSAENIIALVDRIESLEKKITDAREYLDAIDELLKEPVEIKSARQAAKRALSALDEFPF
jgi:hypothetical protein